MATVVLDQHTLGVPFDGTQHNDNLQTIEDSLFDLGPYVIDGLVPSAGTGLAVDVTAGTASIGGRVTVAAFSITGLTPSAVNHLYLLNTGAGASNTSGTAPPGSVKLGTATTDGTGVTSVDTTPASGRQEKVDLTSVVTTTDANAFSAQQTFGLNDAVATISRPVVIRHSNSGGVGAIGIGVGLELQVETATESLFNAAARLDSYASAVTAGAVTGEMRIAAPLAGTMFDLVSVAPAQTSIVGRDTGTTNTLNSLRVNHLSSGVAAGGFGVGIEFGNQDNAGTPITTGGLSSFLSTVGAGATNCAAALSFSVKNTGSASVTEALRLRANQEAAFFGPLCGLAVAPTVKVATVSMAADANQTLTSAQYECPEIRISGGTALTATRDIVMPLTSGARWHVHNNSSGGQSLRFIGSGGTGITVATGMRAQIGSDGVNIVRWSADV